MSSTLPPRSKPGKFRELETYLRQAIADGTWQPGERLPSFADLRQQFVMAPSTVSRALQHLEQDGLVTRRAGSGVYVAEPRAKQLTGVLGFQGFSFGERYVPYWMNLMEGIQNAAHEAGQEVLLLNEDIATNWDNVDGVLVHGERILEGNLKIPARVPRVSVMFSSYGAPTVNADDFGGAKSAVEHLVKLGHTRIGYLCFTDAEVIQPRLAGYHAALLAAGITPEAGWVRSIQLKGGTSVRWLGQANMEDWLADGWSRSGCTGLLVQNDLMAQGVLDALQAAGIRVPEDVSVVGYDGTELCEQSNPTLSSVAVPLERIGAKAVGMLLQQIRGEDVDGLTLSMPTQMVGRGSTQKV